MAQKDVARKTIVNFFGLHNDVTIRDYIVLNGSMSSE